MKEDLKGGFIHSFEQPLSWDIFVQGFIILFCFSIALFLLYTSNDTHEKDLEDKINLTKNFTDKFIKPFNKLLDEQKNTFFKVFLYGFVSNVLIIIIYCLGIVVVNLGDNFMDLSSKKHLGQKLVWLDEKYTDSKNKDYSNTDDVIKYKHFNKILDYNDSLHHKDPIDKHQIKQIYYYSKHKLIFDEKNREYREYLNYSQNLINISQTLSFSFFILFCFTLISLLILTVVHLSSKNKTFIFLCLLSFSSIIISLIIDFYNIEINSSLKHKKLSLIFPIVITTLFLLSFFKFHSFRKLNSIIRAIFISYLLYCASSYSWFCNEIECCNKTYGLLKQTNPDLNAKDYYLIQHYLLDQGKCK